MRGLSVSVRQMAKVWDLELPTTKKMLLLAIADHADDDGDNAWPSVARLAKKVGVEDRSIRRLLRELEAEGWLSTSIKAGGNRATPEDRRPNLYRLHLDRTPKTERGDTQVPSRGDTQVPLTIIGTSITSRAEESAQGRDEIFDALVAACGIWPDRLTPSARGSISRAVKELRSVGATADGITATAKGFAAKWPDALITPTALAKWYGTFSTTQRSTGPSRAVSGRPCESCEGTGWSRPDVDDLGPAQVSRCSACDGLGLVPTNPAA